MIYDPSITNIGSAKFYTNPDSIMHTNYNNYDLQSDMRSFVYKWFGAVIYLGYATALFCVNTESAPYSHLLP